MLWASDVKRETRRAYGAMELGITTIRKIYPHGFMTIS
jgi:hypothetical protein